MNNQIRNFNVRKKASFKQNSKDGKKYADYDVLQNIGRESSASVMKSS